MFWGLFSVGEALFFLWKQKGTRVAQRKNRGQGWKRITSRDRWCILADSRNPFHAQMKAVWEGECVCSVCMMGVAGQGLGLLVSGGREGTFCNQDQCSFSLINDPKPKGNPSYCNYNTINKPIYANASMANMLTVTVLTCLCWYNPDHVPHGHFHIISHIITIKTYLMRHYKKSWGICKVIMIHLDTPNAVCHSNSSNSCEDISQSKKCPPWRSSLAWLKTVSTAYWS